MSCTSILRLTGPSNSEPLIQILRDALASHFKADQPQPSKSDDYDDDCSLVLNMINKYFTANISLQSLDKNDALSSHSQKPSSSDTRKLRSTTTATMKNLTKEDGILLVFPSDPSTSVDASLSLTHESAVKKHQCGDLLRLCISVSMGNKVQKGKAYEEQYSKNVLWCLDRGYEYIEADLTEEGLARGHEDREKDGFARIVEAMMGTVWSSAVMNKQDGKNSILKKLSCTDPISPGQTDNSKEGQSAEPKYFNTFPEKVLNQENSDVITVGKTIEHEQKSQEMDMFSLEDEEETAYNAESGVEKKEKLLDNFERAIREAGRIRDASKAGKLSDGERRQRAGDAAVMIMDLLDKIGVDDDSESDVGDSSEDDM